MTLIILAIAWMVGVFLADALHLRSGISSLAAWDVALQQSFYGSAR